MNPAKGRRRPWDVSHPCKSLSLGKRGMGLGKQRGWDFCASLGRAEIRTFSGRLTCGYCAWQGRFLSSYRIHSFLKKSHGERGEISPPNHLLPEGYEVWNPSHLCIAKTSWVNSPASWSAHIQHPLLGLDSSASSCRQMCVKLCKWLGSVPFGPCILNLTQENPSSSQAMQQEMRIDVAAQIAVGLPRMLLWILWHLHL